MPLGERCQEMKIGWVSSQVQVVGWAVEAEVLRCVMVGKERVLRHAEVVRWVELKLMGRTYPHLQQLLFGGTLEVVSGVERGRAR